MAKKFASPTAFRRALEDRLKRAAAKEGGDLQRLMRKAAFDRLLARLFARAGAPWVLKGGYALELRSDQTRATKDIDLALRKATGKAGREELKAEIYEALKEAAKLDLGDYFNFEVGPAMMDLAGAVYGGARFPVEAKLDGRGFVKFHMDIASGDVVLEPLETMRGRDWLGFAGVPALECPMISREQHFSEKIHAYTLPRGAPNMRVRDLVDMVLLIRMGLKPAQVADALKATFKRRGTHPVPKELAAPPKTWVDLFAKLVKGCGISTDIDAAFAEVQGFYASL